MSKTNPRITKREKGLVKGGIRRAFSRSELREKALNASRVDHYDPERPRVKKWSRCRECKDLVPTYKIDIDHLEPVVPVDRSFDDMSFDEVVDRMWCPEEKLQALCEKCHNTKSGLETKERAKIKKERKQGEKK